MSVAAVNGPASVVVAGDPDALDDAVASLAAEDVRVRRIAVDYASHSAQVDQLATSCSTCWTPSSRGNRRCRSTPTVAGETGLDAGYWYRNLRQPVEFEPAVRALAEPGTRCSSR